MKNHKTMYRIAKAKAIEQGVKTYRMLSGYTLTEREVKSIYADEGFTDPRTMQRHFDLWKEVEWVRIHPIGPNKENIFFFALDARNSDERASLVVLRTKCPDTEEDLPGVLCA